MVEHVLLLLALAVWASLYCAVSFVLHLLCLMELEELFDLGHLEVIVANGPHQPVEVLLQLKELASDDYALEGDGAHLRQPPAHFDLFLHPVSVAQGQQTDHQFDFSMRLYLLELILYLALLLVLDGGRVEAADVRLEARHVQPLGKELQHLLPLCVS